VTENTKRFKENLQEVRNPKGGRLRYRLRKQQEEEDKRYLDDALKHLDEDSETDG
jgi:hypothetical protein